MIAPPTDPLYPHGAPGPLRRFLPRSLLGRPVLIIVTPLILLQVISTWVFYDRHYDTMTKRLAPGMAGDVAAVIALMERNPELHEPPTIFPTAPRPRHTPPTYPQGMAL